ncbi:MAG: transcription termination factor NusA [Pseudomonadota bacterium]
MISEIKRIIDQVSRERGIEQKVLISTLEEALKSAARKKFGINVELEVGYNEELGEIEVFQFKDVVENVENPDLQLSVEAARELDSESEAGDSLGVKIDINSFGRIDAQSAKQVIIQRMKDAERDVVYDSFINRKGEILNGIVQRIERGNVIVNLGRTEGVLPAREQLAKDHYKRGDRIRAYVLDVIRDARGPQIVLSRTHPNFVIMLFKAEVPEISEGIVDVMGAVREPGGRAKIAVASRDQDVDPVGACVGVKGSRVQNVVQELRGEKIDIIPWHADIARFVCSALAPAVVSRVIIDHEADKSMVVIVSDEHLSIAIGKSGQNVRLASRLTGWKIDVEGEEGYRKTMHTGYESLTTLPGVTKNIADALYSVGFISIEELAKATVDDLTQVQGMTADSANELIKEVQNRLAAKNNTAAQQQVATPQDAGEASGQETEPETGEEMQQLEALSQVE